MTRFFISLWFRWRRPKALRIQHFRFIPDGTKIDFMKISRVAIVVSVLLTVGAIGTAVFKGFNLGIDFVGGSAIEVQHTAEGPADPARVRELLEGLNLGEVQVQSFGTPEDLLVRIQLQPGGDAAQQAAVQNITTTLAADEYQVRRTEAVSGTVSGELAFNGTLAVLVSLIAILVYVWFRFEWQFGLAAVTTTAHDVIMTVGLFSLTGLEFNLSSIAAVLTLVGLSLNETVVISDRVRENLRKYKKMSVADIINLSINQTIVRTSLTQFTVLQALFLIVALANLAMPGSARPPDTSLTSTEPASSAAAATSERVVSMLVGTPAAVNASITGTTRAISVRTSTRSAPGRVDSPPTSIRSAPSAIIARPCSTAPGVSANSPPSENESGVTLRTPITTG